MKKLILILPLALALVGCGGPTEGTIVEMRHEDARTYTYWNPCKFMVPVTHVRTNADGTTRIDTDMECRGAMDQGFDDEDWMIKIEKCEGSDGQSYGQSDHKKKECESAWREIDSLLWKQAKVGAYYDGKTVS